MKKFFIVTIVCLGLAIATTAEEKQTNDYIPASTDAVIAINIDNYLKVVKMDKLDLKIQKILPKTTKIVATIDYPNNFNPTVPLVVKTSWLIETKKPASLDDILATYKALLNKPKIKHEKIKHVEKDGYKFSDGNEDYLILPLSKTCHIVALTAIAEDVVAGKVMAKDSELTKIDTNDSKTILKSRVRLNSKFFEQINPMRKTQAKMLLPLTLDATLTTEKELVSTEINVDYKKFKADAIPLVKTNFFAKLKLMTNAVVDLPTQKEAGVVVCKITSPVASLIKLREILQIFIPIPEDSTEGGDELDDFGF